MWSLFVTTPMWLVLVFSLMSANEMPTWAWTLYWCYVPCSILGVVLTAIAKQLLK